ncbi:MAG: EcoKI restriction-modification system protein HsdS [Bacteroidetes bacterium ADurb.BinA174]|nr:MAG: EcoKI restriction-modification system protein HsdS [Bacteroidetes bacterium ADurb.BinA174]
MPKAFEVYRIDEMPIIRPQLGRRFYSIYVLRDFFNARMINNYTIQSDKLNKSRVFILQKSEIEKRFDPFYYIPELVELEKKILIKQPKKLRDYVMAISSGATPKTTESEKYYAEKENGIPFLRVQNLSPTGVLEFDDCKYINEETHNGMLKRSQVSAGDLLVKITGVGRMAVASVAPEGFEGNINQHVCVIKTGSKEISEQLAAFLNTDIGEKLASRRATGGTRPALDYLALLSIPILEDSRILAITQKVVEQKRQNEAEAEKLLASIDDYLLGELGIKVPEPPENTLRNRIFTKNISNLSGSRIDPFYYNTFFDNITKSVSKGKYPTKSLNDISLRIDTGRTPAKSAYVDEETEDKIKIIKAGSYTLDYIDLNKCDFTSFDFKGNEVFQGDIFILGAAHQAEYIGKKVYYLSDALKEKIFFVGELNRITVNPSIYSSQLLFSILKLKPFSLLLNREKRGQTSHLYPDDVKKINVPIPPLEKQQEIADRITDIRQQAQQLKEKTHEALKKASEEIEKILLDG